MKGSRVQAVVQELRGEKIDIVTWDPDPAKFICNALAPAEIVRVIVDEANQSMGVVVPDDQLSLAIGRRGQNVRLASKISGWSLDVTSETDYSAAFKDAYNSLLSLDGVGEATATTLYQEGFSSAKIVAGANVEELTLVKGISKEKAEKLIESAVLYLDLKKTEEKAAKKAEEEAAKKAEEKITAEEEATTEEDTTAEEEARTEEDVTAEEESTEDLSNEEG